MKIQEILIQEYQLAIGMINRVGRSVVTIKGWCITIVAGATAFKGVSDRKFTILLAFLIIVFWLIEASYRVVMQCFKNRCIEIEKYFETPNEDEKTPQLMTKLRDYYSLKAFWNAATMRRCYPLYLALFSVLIMLYLIEWK